MWRPCFLLAWQAFQAASIPVGAVLVDPNGEKASSGRNRSNERTGPAGHVAGSYIAHAEINALPGGRVLTEDALGVYLQEHVDAMSRPFGDQRRRNPGIQPRRYRGMP